MRPRSISMIFGILAMLFFVASIFVPPTFIETPEVMNFTVNKTFTPIVVELEFDKNSELIAIKLPPPLLIDISSSMPDTSNISSKQGVPIANF